MSLELEKRKAQISEMPDISKEARSELQTSLDQVGMGQIEMPVLFRGPRGEEHFLPAHWGAYVSLDQPEAKGIHMSRLYLCMRKHLEQKPISLKVLKELLIDFIASQEGLSKSAYLTSEFEAPVLRKALLSEEEGWRHYPLIFEASLSQGSLAFHLSFRVTYSSTCPCSAALAQQLIHNEFQKDFANQSVIKKSDIDTWLNQKSLYAVPHAQRSYADIKVKLDPDTIAPEPFELIDRIEQALRTPVQSAVKRIDEQEFAKRNGQNLMFCEDAARRIKESLNKESRVIDFVAKVDHQESLHPHSAVSVVTKGQKGGLTFKDHPRFSN